MSIRGQVLGFAAIALFATAALTTPALSTAAADDAVVVATVNGAKILRKDVLSTLKNLPVQATDTEKVFPAVVDQLINEKLVDGAVVAAKVEESKEYKERLDLLQKQLLKQVYLEKFLKDKITDDKVKAAYDKIEKENKGKEEILARHILVPSEEEAKQAIKDLDKGAKFEELAKKRSSGPGAQTGGDLGWFVKEDMIPEFSDAAFKLKKGTYTKEPVKTQFGWHVILVEDKRPRAVPALKEVEMAIRNKLGQEAVQTLVTDLRAKADIKRFDKDGKPLEEPKKN